tara:strand:- start:153 stop:785 length:633 start_codon:yes stop_codon:yes gene_type:complete
MKKNYLLKKASDDKKLFNSCLGIIRKEKYIMISGGKTFFPLHALIDNLKNKHKINIALSDERIVDQEKNLESNFYNLNENIKKNKKIKILGFKKDLNKTINSKILNFFEKEIPLKKIKKIFISPGNDGHFASIFVESKVLLSSTNYEIIKKKNKTNRLTLKFDFFKKNKIYIVLNKKKNDILKMIKVNDSKYPINQLIQQCKKKVTIIYV